MRMNYAEHLRQPGAKEVGPGIIQLPDNRFVADVAQMVPAYLKAIAEGPSVASVAVVKALAQRDMAALAGDPDRIDVAYLKSETSTPFHDASLPGDQKEAHAALLRLDDFQRKLDAYRIRQRQKSVGKIEV